MSIETDLAYLAGIVDGEGSIGASNRRMSQIRNGVENGRLKGNFQVCFQVGMTQVGALEKFAEIFGGKVRLTKQVTRSGKPVFKWLMMSRKAAYCLEQLLPYLVIKKEQARDAIALARMHRQKSGKHKSPGYSNPITQDEYIERSAVYLRMRERNFKGNGRIASIRVDG